MISLIVNPRAGGETRVRNLQSALQARRLDVDVFEARNPRAAAEAAVLAGTDTLIAAGGDGTVSAVASVAVRSGLTLGVIPQGTLNHFARDLGIPLDVEGAADVIVARRMRCVDAGEVNGRIFINNSGVGLYPGLVAFREAHQRRGWGKWAALFGALAVMLRRLPRLEVCLTANNDTVERRTPIIFVGNNEYEVHGVKAGSRQSLESGQLFVSVVTAQSGFDLVRLSVLALLRRLRNAPDFEEFLTTEAVVELRRRLVRVSLDGEVTFLRTPLRYRILPRALRVLAPAQEGSD